MGRIARVLGAAGLALLAGSCIRYVRYEVPPLTTGTCAGACRHYASCKHDARPTLVTACERECGGVFETDGVPDRESIREFERMDCATTIGFVEGASGRGPGQARAQPR